MMKLKKELGYFSLTNIVMANMIGAGIFTTSGLLLGQLQDPRIMLVLWGVGGGLALCGALSYGELGATIPKAGGEYVFLSELFSPLVGFLSGWISFIVGFSAPIAASSLAFSEYLMRSFQGLASPEQAAMVKKLLAAGVVLLFTFIHYFGLRSGARVQNILTMVKIGLIVALVVAGFAFGEGSMGHFREMADKNGSPATLRTMGLALMWIMFAFSGWNASTYVGSEIIHPSRNIPGSLITGTLMVTLIYLSLNVLFVYAVPAAEMKGIISVGGLAANHLFNRSMDRIFSLFISVILLSSISSLILIGPRVYYAMARSGHFFRLAGRINPAGVPGTSIFLQSGLALLFIFSGTFDQIITVLGFSLGIFPILAVFGVFVIRSEKRSAVRMPGYPILQLLFIILSMAILVLAYLERPVESSIALLVILTGIPVFYLLKNRKMR